MSGGRRLGGLARQRGWLVVVITCESIYFDVERSCPLVLQTEVHATTKTLRNTLNHPTTMSNPPGLPGVERRYAQVNGLKYRESPSRVSFLYPRLSRAQPRQTTSLARRVTLTRTPSSSSMVSLTFLMVGERSSLTCPKRATGSSPSTRLGTVVPMPRWTRTSRRKSSSTLPSRTLPVSSSLSSRSPRTRANKLNPSSLSGTTGVATSPRGSPSGTPT